MDAIARAYAKYSDNVIIRTTMNESDHRKALNGHKFDDDHMNENARLFKSTFVGELSQLEHEHNIAKESIANAREEAIARGDFDEVRRLDNAERELDRAFSMCQDRPPGMHHSTGKYDEMWRDRLDALSAATDAAFAEVANNPTEGATASATATPSPEEAGATTTTEGTPEAAEAESTTGAEGSTEKEQWVKLEGDYVNRMMDMITRDPEALLAEIESMPTGQRMHVMQMVQQNLQELNRMHTMMTNFAKAMHDTQKAVLSNFRV